MQASFWLFHLKKISIFVLNFFCSYCFCFLLLTKFSNTARISSIFYERTHSVCCSLQSHASLSWVLESSYNFKPLYPIRLLWYIVWAPFPCMALLFTAECFCSTAIIALCGLMESALGPCVPKLCEECENSTATTVPEAGCTVLHMPMTNRWTKMWIMKRTKPTMLCWVSHDNFVAFLQCHYPCKGSCKMLFACHYECSFLVWIMTFLVLCSTWGSYFEWWAHERESEH